MLFAENRKAYVESRRDKCWSLKNADMCVNLSCAQFLLFGRGVSYALR